MRHIGGASDRSTLATAIAAIPSPRPSAPMPSLVVALMPTRAMSMPSAAAIFSRIAVEMRRDLRRFCDQGGVDITRSRIFLRQQFRHPAQNLETADSANRFVGVRKMMADVALADRA